MNKFKTRRESSIINIRIFHNWIKRQLINEAVAYLKENYEINKISLLDLAVGKGGDMNKWYDAGIMNVVGFDIDEESINGVNGAISRYNDMIKQLKRRNIKELPIYEFYVMDLSNPANINKIENIIRNRKFQITSCQFAIHYFFKNETTLDTLIKIISLFKDENCFFLGTTMNGDKIRYLVLNDQRKLENDLYKIECEITSNIKLPYANKYYVSLGKESDKEHYFVNKKSEEYLVNLDELKRICDKYGLNYIGNTEFKRWYELYQATNPKYKLNEAEKEFSFLNMSFVFMSKKS